MDFQCPNNLRLVNLVLVNFVRMCRRSHLIYTPTVIKDPIIDKHATITKNDYFTVVHQYVQFNRFLNGKKEPIPFLIGNRI